MRGHGRTFLMGVRTRHEISDGKGAQGREKTACVSLVMCLQSLHFSLQIDSRSSLLLAHLNGCGADGKGENATRRKRDTRAAIKEENLSLGLYVS